MNAQEHAGARVRFHESLKELTRDCEDEERRALIEALCLRMVREWMVLMEFDPDQDFMELRVVLVLGALYRGN
jgi:hypothetical protein